MFPEINAAATVSALVHSQRFDLTSTYFMVAGIGGVNPEVATICAVTFARYAIQVAMQYEIDPRELPANFSTGYVPQGSTSPTAPKSSKSTKTSNASQHLSRARQA
jgi:purine nucleoside permease